MLVRRAAITPFLVAGLVIAACGGSDDTPASVSADLAEAADTSASVDTTSAQSVDTVADEPADDVQMFPDVIDATAVQEGSTWTFAATLSSPYDTPERYADAWRVVGADGTIYGERILTHDHASEHPFTRSQSGIEIPDDVTTVTIEGRDQEFGYGGDTFDLTLPR